MTHWKLTLAYDGTSFHGWQIQPELATVQGLLSDALFRVVSERVLPQGSGRTDAGVHALGQVASFSLEAGIPAGNLQRALNDVLPASVRVLAAESVAADFHARHSAVGKTYEYRIFPLRAAREAWGDSRRGDARNICPPMLAPYVWACRWPLDLRALRESARHVVGVHDFTSFAACDPDASARGRMTAEGEENNWLVGGPKGRQVAGAKAHVEGGEVVPGRKSRPISCKDSVDISQGKPEENGRGSFIRTVTRSEWAEADGLLIYRVTANGFLHHMVRNLVGTLVECGAGRLAVSSIPKILAARNRSAAGPTAPASGLFLVSVEYPAQAVRGQDVP